VIAASAWFDDEGDARVRQLWRALADAGVDDSMHAGPYRPHITLGLWKESPVDVAVTAQFSVTFRAFGVYPGHRSDPERRPGIWLAPTVSHELRDLHERIHDRAPGSLHRHVPGRWEPHCTLASRLRREDIARAVAVVVDADALPLTVTITRIGLVDTPAEVELASIPLTDE
jgi:2'-5' RNA ligase